MENIETSQTHFICNYSFLKNNLASTFNYLLQNGGCLKFINWNILKCYFYLVYFKNCKAMRIWTFNHLVFVLSQHVMRFPKKILFLVTHALFSKDSGLGRAFYTINCDFRWWFCKSCSMLSWEFCNGFLITHYPIKLINFIFQNWLITSQVLCCL